LSTSATGTIADLGSDFDSLLTLSSYYTKRSPAGTVQSEPDSCRPGLAGFTEILDDRSKGAGAHQLTKNSLDSRAAVTGCEDMT
jgi:hypothetical protein